MVLRLGLAQSGYPGDGDVPAQVEAFAKAAALAGAQLLVFPENLMQPRPLDAQGLLELSEPLDGPFANRMRTIAHDHSLWVVFTMSESNASGARPYNTAVIVDDQGDIRASYRKCHLYDAHSVHESDRMSVGDSLCTAVTTPFCTLGVGICYDLRFPEVARSLAAEGCDLIVFPASWHDGPHKRSHWETLLRARAIENECFVAGACHAGKHLVEDSLVASPLGEILPSTSIAIGHTTKDWLLVTEIDMDQAQTARSAMPILEHRRPALYQSLVSEHVR